MHYTLLCTSASHALYSTASSTTKTLSSPPSLCVVALTILHVTCVFIWHMHPLARRAEWMYLVIHLNRPQDQQNSHILPLLRSFELKNKDFEARSSLVAPWEWPLCTGCSNSICDVALKSPYFTRLSHILVLNHHGVPNV